MHIVTHMPTQYTVIMASDTVLFSSDMQETIKKQIQQSTSDYVYLFCHFGTHDTGGHNFFIFKKSDLSSYASIVDKCQSDSQGNDVTGWFHQLRISLQNYPDKNVVNSFYKNLDYEEKRYKQFLTMYGIVFV